MAEVKWIKIATDIFDDEKILLIESMPDADALIVIWLKLLVLAGKNNNGGVLMMNGAIPYTEEMLATIFRRPLNTVRLALTTFERFGMVEIINDVVTLPNWEKHQNLDGLEKIRKQNRERVARYRAKQKQLTNGDVTLQLRDGNSTEQEQETDTDKELNSCCCKSVLSLMTEQETEMLFNIYEDADKLIDAVDDELKRKNKFGEIINAYRYVVGYAENKYWVTKL